MSSFHCKRKFIHFVFKNIYEKEAKFIELKSLNNAIFMHRVKEKTFPNRLMFLYVNREFRCTQWEENRNSVFRFSILFPLVSLSLSSAKFNFNLMWCHSQWWRKVNKLNLFFLYLYSALDKTTTLFNSLTRSLSMSVSHSYIFLARGVQFISYAADDEVFGGAFNRNSFWCRWKQEINEFKTLLYT